MISVRVTVPRNVNTRQFTNAIEKARDETANEILRQFQITTTTWQHSVLFEKRNKSFNKVDVFTTDLPYFFVNNGTRVRRALMSLDFMPKSKERQLRQGPGSGGVVYISRRVNKPKIEAREYDKVIAKLINKFMVSSLELNLRSVR